GGDVEDEGGFGVQAEVDAEVVEDAVGEVRLPGQVGLGELGPEAGRVHQGAGGDVVGVGVLPVGGQEETRPQFPQHAGQAVPRLQVGDQRAVRQAEVAAPVEAEHGGGRLGLALAD